MTRSFRICPVVVSPFIKPRPLQNWVLCIKKNNSFLCSSKLGHQDLEFPWGMHSTDIFICRGKYTPAESENLGNAGRRSTTSISVTLKKPLEMPASNFSIFSSVYSVLCRCMFCVGACFVYVHVLCRCMYCVGACIV